MRVFYESILFLISENYLLVTRPYMPQSSFYKHDSLNRNSKLDLKM